MSQNDTKGGGKDWTKDWIRREAHKRTWDVPFLSFSWWTSPSVIYSYAYRENIQRLWLHDENWNYESEKTILLWKRNSSFYLAGARVLLPLSLWRFLQHEVLTAQGSYRTRDNLLCNQRKPLESYFPFILFVLNRHCELDISVSPSKQLLKVFVWLVSLPNRRFQGLFSKLFFENTL